MCNCRMIGQCIFNYPMAGQCVSNCPMVGQWISYGLIIGQCIFHYLMVGKRISTWPIVGQCMYVQLSNDLKCMFNCPMIGHWMSSCPLVRQCRFNCLMFGQCISNYSMVFQIIVCIALNIWTESLSQQTVYLKAYVTRRCKVFRTFPARESFKNIHLLSDNFGLTKSCYWTVLNFSDPCLPGRQLVYSSCHIHVVFQIAS